VSLLLLQALHLPNLIWRNENKMVSGTF
jgi:hypothetical protein